MFNDIVVTDNLVPKALLVDELHWTSIKSTQCPMRFPDPTEADPRLIHNQTRKKL
jgi:hypothetical protein